MRASSTGRPSRGHTKVCLCSCSVTVKAGHVCRWFAASRYVNLLGSRLTLGRALLTRLTYTTLLLRLPSSFNPPPALLHIIKQAASDSIGIITSQTLDRELYARHLNTLDILDLHLKAASDPNAATPRLVDIQGLVGPHAVPGWYETAEEQLRKESIRLDVELKGYMSNLIKESIRVSGVEPTYAGR